MYNTRNRLFSEEDLGSRLRGLGDSLRNHIQDMDAERIKNADEATLVAEIVETFSIDTPTLLTDRIKVEPREANITVRGDFRSLDEDEVYVVKGLVIEVRIPFTGPEHIFQCRPSTRTFSGTPTATIHRGELVLSYETNKKDPEAIKSLWANDISVIQQYLGWISTDLSRYNATLEENVRAAVSNRRLQVSENQSLMDALKT